jgi:tetratricopeptide (TPR) repeat protein
MSTKQNSSDKTISNGANTAVYISRSNGNQQSEKDLVELAEICLKSNNPFTLYAPSDLKSSAIAGLQKESRIKTLNGNDLGDDIKNVLTLQLPLSNKADTILKWALNANKAFNGQNMVAAFGRNSEKSNFYDKHLVYWTNFWPKFFTGANSNLASCEAILLSEDDFNNLVIGKKIDNPWQLAALGEKEGLCTKVPFEYKASDFKLGDASKSFAKGLLDGVKTLINYFFKAVNPGTQISDKTDINHGLYKKIFGFSALFLLIGMLSISNDYNVTWDEPNHNNYSQDVLDYYTSMGEDTSMFDFQAEGHRDNFTNVLYGMGIDVLASGVNRIIGTNETAEPKDMIAITFTGNIVDSLFNNQYKRYPVDESGFIEHRTLGKINVSGKTLPEIKSIIRDKLNESSVNASVSVGFSSFKTHHAEFVTRHILNTITGFLAILFASLLVRMLSGWLPAIITLIALVCSPSFFGQCFNNPKDIPFAAGYIMSLYFLVRLLKELPNARHQTKVMLALAIGFTISIRVQGVLPLGFLLMFMGLHWLLNYANKKDNKFLVYVKHGLLIGIVAYILGILFWPYALRNPINGTLKALTEFDKFSYLTYYELFEGVRLFDKPWYYEPKLIMLTAPLAVLAGLVPGVLLGWKNNRTQRLMVGLVLLATFFPSAYIIYKKSYVYNGWRHFIFIYPSLVAIAVLGWHWLSSLFKSNKIKMGLMLIIGLTFIKPGIWSIVNHPYQYIYFNEIAGGVEGANGLYELDYWNQTPRAAFKWLIKNHPEVLKGDIKVSSNNIQEALKTFVPEGKDVKYAWTREYEWADNNWTYAIWTTRTLSKNQILNGYWPPKGTIHEIKVDGVTIAAVVRSNSNYSYLGKQCLKKNNGDSALWYYQQAYTFNPLEEEYARGLADACKMKMKLDSAVMFYKKAIELRDGNYEAYQSLGEVYYTQALMADQNNPNSKMLEMAFDNLSLAFKHKKNASAPLIMGEIRLQQKNALEAKMYFNLFNQAYGNVGRGYLGLGKAELILGEQDSAFYNLQAAIQLDPRNPEAYGIIGTELQKTGRSKEAEQFLNEYMKLTGMPQQ